MNRATCYYDCTVIGGGASGLVFAVCAARRGLTVTVLEKEERVGRKLLSTGNGRCNLSNTDISVSHYHGSCARFVPSLLEDPGAEGVREFWASMGIEYTQQNGRYYPRSLQASSVLNALRRECAFLGANLRTGVRAEEAEIVPKGYRVRTEKEDFDSPVLVLAAGGKACPKLGGSSSGIDLARSLGLKVTALRPGLCRLKSEEQFLRSCDGVRLTIPCRLMAGSSSSGHSEPNDRQCLAEVTEEVLLTKDGLSGPASLSLSRMAGQALAENRPVWVSLDLASEYTKGELFAYLQDRAQRLSRENSQDFLEGFVHKRLIPEILRRAQAQPSSFVGSWGSGQLGRLAGVLKDFTISVSRLDGYQDAQVMVGGVEASCLTADMQASAHKGLYVLGELQDLDGDCGGYNLLYAAMSALKAAEKAGEDRS